MAPAPPSAPRRSPVRWLALPGAMVVVAIGVWVTGGVLTENETVAKGLTGLWLLLAGVIAVAIAWRRRDLAAPVLVGYGLAAVGIGGFLGYTSMVDQVVDEDVVVATSPSVAPEDTDKMGMSRAAKGKTAVLETNLSRAASSSPGLTRPRARLRWWRPLTGPTSP